MASLGGTHPASPQAAPPGWHVSWSEEHNHWYYVNTATGFSQWEWPSGLVDASQPGATLQSPPQLPNQHQQPQPELGSPSPDTQPGAQGEQSRGLMSFAAGAFMGHEMTEHKPHFGDRHNIFGSMATVIGSAGVGALGAKLFGGKTKPQAASPPQPAPSPAHAATWASPPPYQSYPAVHSSPSVYPVPMGPPMPLNGPNHGQYGTAMSGATNFSHNQHQPMSPPPTTGSGATGAFYGGSSPSGPRLIIHAAYFADKDVTEKVRMLVRPEQKISFEKMKDEFGDPWPEAERKALSILYQYGDRPMEVWAGSTENHPVAIQNEALSNERMMFVNKNPGRIVSLIWGQASVLTDLRIEKLEKDGELDCKDLGDGGWWGWEPRTLICYYRSPDGTIKGCHAREGGTLRLPWNPLAKWS